MSSAPTRRSSTRSKPSSIRHAAPLSLRSPSGRKPSTAHISLVFADTLVSGSDGALTSEETLLRQLDGDLGGRQIGLRSRRGSSATLRTVRTRGGSVASMALLEEGENGQAIAGPSKPSGTIDTSILPSLSPDVVESPLDHRTTLPVDRSRRTVNPKNSSSWLRWNSPAPSFPRSISPASDKGKGKGRADGTSRHESHSERGRLAVGPSESPSPERLPESSTATPADPTVPPPTATLKPPDIPRSTATSSPARRSWFGRIAAQSAAAPHSEDPPDATKTRDQSAQSMEEPGKHAEASAVTQVEPEIIHQSPVSGAPPDLQGAAVKALTNPGAGSEQKGQVAEDAQVSSGWASYFWGTGKAKAAHMPEEPQTSTQDPPLDSEVVENGEAHPGDDTSNTSPTPAPTVPEVEPDSSKPTDKPSQASQAQERPGWGSYFYPFVTPKPPPLVPSPPRDDAAKDDTEVVEPASGPAADQPPIPAPSPDPPKLNGNANLAPPPSQPMTRSDHEPETMTPKSTPRDRVNSNASASGWLNYLAFRASQKKITNPSTTSIKSGKEKKRMSLDVGEEVMDFSTDPNFPTAQAEDAKKDTKTKEKVDPKSTTLSTSKSSKPLSVRQRKLSNTSSRSGTRTPVPASPKAPSKLQAPAKTPNKGAAPPAPALPNLVIPSFENTFSRPPRSLPPSYTQNGLTGTTWRAIGAVGNYVYGENPPSKDIRGQKAGRGVGNDLPRKVQTDDGWKSVKRIAIVGVHGWFPARMLNSVIGEPTGTSVKFASMMEQAVRKFFKDRGVDTTQLRITPMPLEGEGTIEHRVDRLYNAYLANVGWVNDLRRADAIFFAAHSQGCIVTTHLISRMIAQGHIRTPFNRDATVRCEWAFGPVDIIPDTSRKRAPAADQKVAMLSMCGVHLGPLYSISTSSVIQPYLQWFENAAARELFEFQESTSAVSTAYQKVLSMVLENGVKVVLLASLNDQVVPIYGASFSTATHPLLLRALFVDGASYAQSDFMTHLLSFAFMLRNAGINDQRLVEHLSEATAGSLTGLGHSSPYEELGCYSIAVEYLFLSGSVNSARPSSSPPVIPLVSEAFSAKEARNDYELPYLMRAIVDSPEINDLFPEELKALKDGIGSWKPATKALKEVKRRLEPMANRQSPLSSSITASQSSTTVSTLKKDW